MNPFEYRYIHKQLTPEMYFGLTRRLKDCVDMIEFNWAFKKENRNNNILYMEWNWSEKTGTKTTIITEHEYNRLNRILNTRKVLIEKISKNTL
jgi:hypothetical protein